MYLLIEILDGTPPEEINILTQVELRAFKKLEDAIIYAEPEHMDHESSVALDDEGCFGVIPRTNDPYVPELERKWTDRELGDFYFRQYALRDS